MKSPTAAKALLAGLFLLAASVPALAASDKPVTTTDIQMTQQAALVVPRDRVVATLRVIARGPNARQIQIDINHRMLDALAKVKAAPNVTAETGSYSVNHPFTPQGESSQWHGEQVLTLSSGDFEAVLTLAGTLQNEGLVMGEMRFFVSPDSLKAVQDELTATALKTMQDRARNVAGDLTLKVVRYKTITIGNAQEETGESPTSRRAAIASRSQGAAARGNRRRGPGDADRQFHRGDGAAVTAPQTQTPRTVAGPGRSFSQRLLRVRLPWTAAPAGIPPAP